METKTLVTETSMGIRLPQELKDRLQLAAEAEDQSLSEWVKGVLSDHLDDPARKAIPKLEPEEQAALDRFLKRQGFTYLSTYLRHQLVRQLQRQGEGGLFEEDDEELLALARRLAEE
jgi:predicted transcriptional regulator